MRIAETTGNEDLRKQVLIDSFHAVKITTVLLHSIAPFGCEMIRQYLKVDEKLWDWNYIFSPIYDIIDDYETHRLKFLKPRVDFFKKHPCQLKNI